MTTLLDVQDLSNPGPAVQTNFEALDPVATYLAFGTGVPSSGLAATKLMYLRTDAASGARLYVREAGVWVAK